MLDIANRSFQAFHAGGWLSNLVIGIILLLVGPLVGFLMNSQKAMVVGAACGVTLLVWLIAFIVLGQLTESAKSTPPLTDWVSWLNNGQAVDVEIASLPEHLKRSMVIPGQTYRVTFVSDPCMWQSSGSAQHPSAGLVRNHFNQAGPKVRPLFTVSESRSQTAECSRPKDLRFWLMDIELTFDANGTVYNDYAPYGRIQVGRLRKAT